MRRPAEQMADNACTVAPALHTRPGAQGEGMPQAYDLNGLKLECEFHLPALAPWDGPRHTRSDIVVRRAAVPPHLDSPDHVAPIFQTKGASEYLMVLPGTARILVRNGDEVLVDAESDADASRIISGPLQAVLWHQRGLLPLHGSVVVVGNQAVALCGHSAAGKSTLAAVLARRGHAVVADDVCVLDPYNGHTAVLAGCGRLRLWRDALDRLGIEPQTLERAAKDKEKYVLDCSRRSEARYRLAAVILLSRRNSGAVSIERLRGARATSTLLEIVLMRRPASALTRDPDIFAGLTRLVAGGVAVWRLNVSRSIPSLDEAATLALSVLEA
jgi:hypothetical protein